MPELPEVETIVRGLQPLCGATVRRVQVLDRKLSLPTRSLTGDRFLGIRRRGKYIVIDLESGRSLVVHLRMSGRLLLSCDGRETKHVRLSIVLDQERILFVDPRRLGTVECVEGGVGARLGIEPLGRSFTPRALAAVLASSRAPVKVFLLDQQKVAGIGNIYAAEALWRARIDPGKRARDLTPEEAKALHEAIQAVLREAIAHAGTSLGSSVSDFHPDAGRESGYQRALSVYGREGEPCVRCGDAIERKRQAGRSTYLCPTCQNETGHDKDKRQRRRR